jgi:hypothetical protein
MLKSICYKGLYCEYLRTAFKKVSPAAGKPKNIICKTRSKGICHYAAKTRVFYGVIYGNCDNDSGRINDGVRTAGQNRAAARFAKERFV